MIEQLKKLALAKLQETMSSNSLNTEATNEAASEGTNALFETIKGVGMSQITVLFAGSGDSDSGIVDSLKGKLNTILQEKGMSASEAEVESKCTAENLVSGLKEKFQSSDSEDKDFDISNISSLFSGGLDDIMDKAKSGDVGGLFNSAKKLFS